LVGKQRRYKNIQPRQHHLAKSIFLVSGGGKSIKCSKQIKITKYKCGGREKVSHMCMQLGKTWRHAARGGNSKWLLKPRPKPGWKWEMENPRLGLSVCGTLRGASVNLVRPADGEPLLKNLSGILNFVQSGAQLNPALKCILITQMCAHRTYVWPVGQERFNYKRCSSDSFAAAAAAAAGACGPEVNAWLAPHLEWPLFRWPPLWSADRNANNSR